MALVVSLKRKGGSCSSTMCANLATTWGKPAFRDNVAGVPERDPYTVKLLDADPQQSLMAWAQMSDDGDLRELVAPVTQEAGSAFAETLEHIRDAYGFAIVDCAPGFDPLALQAASVADIIIIPCRPSPLDILAAADALEVAKIGVRGRDNAQIFFSPQANLPRTRLGRELPEELARLGKNAGAEVLPSISARVIIAEAAASGLTCREIEPDGEAAQEFAILGHAIEKALGLPESPNT